jgi:hypothetical protein
MQPAFVFTRPLEAREIVDRRDEITTLLGHIDDGTNVRLTSPRDFGKTSLLARTLWEADRRGTATVRVDLYGARTAGQIAMLVERAYEQQLKGPLARAFAAIRRRGGTIGVHTSEVGGALTVPGAQPGERELLDLLDLPLRLHQKTGTRFAIAFDEFQVVLSAGDGLDGLIRSVIQHHGDAATYVFAGSHPGMMRELFASKRRPFYGQAAPLELGPLPDEDLGDYISARFERARRDPGPALDWLLDLVRGHPQRAMLMAHLLYDETQPGKIADDEAWAGALEAAWPYVRDDFERTWDVLSPLESGVVEAVALATKGLNARDTRERFSLPAGSAATSAAKRLADQGVLRRESSRATGFALVDPMFDRWVAAGRRWE